MCKICENIYLVAKTAMPKRVILLVDLQNTLELVILLCGKVWKKRSKIILQKDKERRPSTKSVIPPAKQLSLQQSMSSTLKLDRKYEKQKTAEMMLIYWLIQDNQACSTVDNERFHMFVDKLNRKFHIVSEKELRTSKLSKLYNEVHFWLANMFYGHF